MSTTTKTAATKKPAAKKPTATKAPAAAKKSVASTPPAQADVGSLIKVAPPSLDLATNIRRKIHLPKQFTESIRARGVQVPLLASYDPLGTLLVWDGQRRLQAALDAGLDEVPVVVTDPPGDEADRILSQDLVNHHRDGLTPADQAEAYAQLAMFGMSAESIAKKTHRPVADVQAGLSVSSSQTTSKLAEATQVLDLPRLARIAAIEEEFGDQMKGVVEDLVTVAEHGDRGEFDHALAEVEQDLENERVIQPLVQQLQDQGITVLDERPYWDDKAAASLGRLADTDGEPLADDAHSSCPGHAVNVYAARDYQNDTISAASESYCMDWKAYGHRDRYRANQPAEVLSEEELEAQRMERRRVRDLNAKSVASSTVRQEFIREFLQRKTLPPNVPLVVAHLVISTGVADYSNRSLAWDLYGTPDPGYTRDEEIAAVPTADKGMKWLLANVAAKVESAMTGNHKDYWQHPYAEHHIYLKALQAWGYTLSDVEHLVVYGDESPGGDSDG